jgi:hypothetical protein
MNINVFYIFHPFKKYGVIVQNGAHTLKIHIHLIDIMNMTSTPMALDSCHDNILWDFLDTGRVTPMHRAHLLPVATSPLVDPLLEPWESCVSNDTHSPM